MKRCRLLNRILSNSIQKNAFVALTALGLLSGCVTMGEGAVNSICCLVARKCPSVLKSLIPACPGSPRYENRAVGRLAQTRCSRSQCARRTELPGIYFFFSFFCFRFSFGLSFAVFCCSFLPLSLFPLSPISVSPNRKVDCVGTRLTDLFQVSLESRIERL